jgi:hypothetical protein
VKLAGCLPSQAHFATYRITFQNTKKVSVRNSETVPSTRWAGAFSESLVRLHCTTATGRKALEAGRLLEPCLGWRPITRGFGEVPDQPLQRLSGYN